MDGWKKKQTREKIEWKKKMDGWIGEWIWKSNDSLNRSAQESFVSELDYANCAVCVLFT